MTIEKEARDLIIWMYDLEKDYEFGEGRYQTLYKKVCKVIGKALQKKQDKIEELESALKEAVDYIPDKKLFERAKKAIGGGNG